MAQIIWNVLKLPFYIYFPPCYYTKIILTRIEEYENLGMYKYIERSLNTYFDAFDKVHCSLCLQYIHPKSLLLKLEIHINTNPLMRECSTLPSMKECI